MRQNKILCIRQLYIIAGCPSCPCPSYSFFLTTSYWLFSSWYVPPADGLFPGMYLLDLKYKKKPTEVFFLERTSYVFLNPMDISPLDIKFLLAVLFLVFISYWQLSSWYELPTCSFLLDLYLLLDINFLVQTYYCCFFFLLFMYYRMFSSGCFISVFTQPGP